MRLKSLIAWLGLLLGLIGMVACGAGIAVVWSVASRLSHANGQLFEQVDESLVNVRNRLLDAQQRVQQSKFSTNEVEESLRSWTRQKTTEQIASRLEISEKTQTLSRGLGEANAWMQASEALLQNIEKALQIGHTLGAPVDTEFADPLIEKVADMQSRLSLAIETVDEIHDRAGELSEEESREERFRKLSQLILKAVATLSEIDTRLGESAARMSETRVAAQKRKATTGAYVRRGGLIASALLAWMAIGQMALCSVGWHARGKKRA